MGTLKPTIFILSCLLSATAMADSFYKKYYSYDYDDPEFDYAAQEEKVEKEERFKNAKREFSIVVAEEGYYPESFSVFEGEKVKFYVTSITKQKSCFMLPSKNLFLAANRNSITEGEVIFEDAGVYQYYCPAGKIKGHITVLKRPEKEGRKIARFKRKNHWMPRDY